MVINQYQPKTAPLNASGSQRVAKNRHGRTSGYEPKVRFVFTKRAIDALPLPSSGIATYYDKEERGLQLRVFPSRKKTFSLYRKVNGRPERIRIGHYPDLTIDQARKEAQRLKGSIAQGQNPAKEKREGKKEWTLGTLFDDYLSQYARKKKRTWYQEQSTYNCHLREKLAERKLSTITNDELTRLHTALSADHPYMANRVIELAVGLFDYARSHQAWAGENPARGIKANREHKRKRFLYSDELPRLFQSLVEEENTTVRDYIVICLFTGARSKRNVLEMRWEEIHWRRSIWLIPGEKFKNGEAEENQLIPEIVQLLKERKAAHDVDPLWVFPGTGKTGHLVEPKGAWKRILKRAGIADCRMHDLRRTYGSWQAITGSSLPIIGASLGHKSPDSTAIYARLHNDPVRNSIERATRAMMVEGKMPQGLLPALPPSKQ